MSTISEVREDKEKEGGFYVVEAVEVSSESEPEDVDDISDIEEYKAEDDDI